MNDENRFELERIVSEAERDLADVEKRRTEIAAIMEELEANLLSASELLKRTNERIFEFRSIIQDTNRMLGS
jgi:hypothetical protein